MTYYDFKTANTSMFENVKEKMHIVNEQMGNLSREIQTLRKRFNETMKWKRF